MERSSQSDSGEFGRRTILASALGAGAAVVLAGCDVTAGTASSAPTTVDVDFGKTAFFPLLKSKIGVGRALNSTEILDSMRYLDQIRPAVYDAELRFPDRSYPSLTPYPFEVTPDGTVTVRPNDFLTTLFTGLHQRNMEIMVQLEGAPYPWWNDTDLPPERPHLFPMPKNLPAAADAIGKWAKLYSAYPISWCMWNEPNHNLTGTSDLKSVNQMVEIYDAYTSAIAPPGLFGMASFISPSEPVRKDLGNRTYFQAVIDKLRTHRQVKPDLPFDYLTLNSYGEDLGKLWDGARNALGADFNTVPLIQAQSGVFKPGDWMKEAGTSLEAARYLPALRDALQVPDLQTFTFSGWISHLIDYKDGTALQLPLYNALKLYARMPDSRGSVQTTLPSGVGAMASGDEYRSAVMVWNETSQPQTVHLQMSNVAGSGQSGAKLSVYHIDSRHGSPKEQSGNDFTPTEVDPVSGNARTLSKTVTVAGPGIAYVEVGTAAPHPVLDRNGLSATLVRKHTYADRVAGTNGTTSVRGNAYGCYDAVRAIAYGGVQGNAGTALIGAEYRGLPDTLPVAVSADRLAPQASSLFGIRIDYVLAGNAAKSALWHGDIFDSNRTSPLPWGRGGATADVLVQATRLDRSAGPGNLVLDLAGNAPSGWAQAGRQAIVSFWMDSTGPGSQARFVLG